MELKNKSIHVYTFGSASMFQTKAPGAWAYIVVDEETGKEYRDVKSILKTTYNKMELTAMYYGLLKAIEIYNPLIHSSIKIYNGSKYIINAFHQGFVYKWEQNHWRGIGTHYPIKHQEFWIPILALTKYFPVEYIKVNNKAAKYHRIRNDYMSQVHITATDAMKDLNRSRGFQYQAEMPRPTKLLTKRNRNKEYVDKFRASRASDALN